MKKTIRVTKADIEIGCRYAASGCPVAIAIKRAFDEPNVGVAEGVIVVDNRETKTPIQATRFIQRFDAGKPVRPFKFTIDLK